MKNRPPARLLDVSRLLSRAGNQQTGIDRVEFAYLTALIDHSAPVFGLARSALGYLLLDRDGLCAMRDTLGQGQFGPADWIGRFNPKLSKPRAGLEATLRRRSIARCTSRRLGQMLTRRLPRGISYINVGHSNLTDAVIRAVHALGGKISVFVHDTIPLDTPHFTSRDSVPRFAGFLARAGRSADVIICNSNQTHRDVLRHVSTPKPDRQLCVAPLGVSHPVPGALPSGDWTMPYFVAVGTIEPRKNHALLLDVWQEMGPTAPHLIICGARGWADQALLARLDARPVNVHEISNLEDAQLFALLQNSAGLLFPSLSEGFGLPPYEAAALGVPVVCSDLPVLQEGLGNIPVYLNPTDRYLWRRKITELAEAFQAQIITQRSKKAGELPTWDDHFDVVLNLV